MIDRIFPGHRRQGAFLSFGFRPFFLAAALFGGLAMLLWLPMLAGDATLPTTFAPLEWHVHEMLFGYLSAVLAGFLLTAVPSWTGCDRLRGPVLGWLALAWLAGRAAVAVSAWIGAVPAAVIDLAFMPLLIAWAASRIVAAGKTRNLAVLAVVGAFFAGDVLFHWEAAQGRMEVGLRLGLAAAVMLVMVIGGRIVPAFTRNWLATRGPGRMPGASGRLEAATVAVAVLALLAWVAAPSAAPVAALLLLAGLAQSLRLARWAGERTGAEPLLLILHLGYACVPTGFLLMGAAALWPDVVPVSSAIHAWTVGAVGLMTLAVMTRATLGHTGRPLTAGVATRLIYVCAGGALLARLCAPLAANPLPLLYVAGGLWVAAFLGFAAAYSRMLTAPRLGAAE